MKKSILILCIFGLSFHLFANPVTGGDTSRVDGKLILSLMADDYYNGYYYGQLLGERVMDVMENYVIKHSFGGSYGYTWARQSFDQYFSVDQKYIDIASGMIHGIQAGGVSIYSPTLQEDLTYKDILIANTIPDFTAFKGLLKIKGPGCSNLTSYGTATADDPWLNGESVISRNLDWESHPVLIENQLIIVWGQTTENTQKFITIGFAGMIGALSGFNESGVATFQNMGNYSMSPEGSGFYPVNLAQRNGLEAADYNNDGVCNARDITDAVRDQKLSSTYIIHSSSSSVFDTPAEVLEIHNSLGDTIRTPENSTPSFTDNLIATNHFRLLASPTYCPRYTRICDSLEMSEELDVQRNWDVLTTAGVSYNLQTIQYTPKDEVFWVSFAIPGTPAYQIEPTKIYANDLFLLVGMDERNPEEQNHGISIIPNPCQTSTNITIQSKKKGMLSTRILDSHGNVVHDFGKTLISINPKTFYWNTKTIAPGVYYCISEFTGQNGHLEKGTEKIIVTR